MCGIFGKINYSSNKPVTEDQIRSALELLSHRGPDDHGFYIGPRAGLGMRRLNIIDIAGGHQPIYNEDKTLLIVYNGEIYNYTELREELLKKGHAFRTKSDTEVILHLYEEYGRGCLEKLNGMFAFAVWDIKNEELFLARDRTGIKPLFYALVNGSLIFSSELRALLAQPEISREMDNEALVDYLSFYYVSSPRTMYAKARRLPPGHFMTVKGGNVEIRRYWKFTFKNEPLGEDECVDTIRATLSRSVKRHLQSEVPLGVFLSSGIDSTALVALMSEYTSDIKTFTVGYEDGGTYNELNEARLVAKKYNTHHADCMLSARQVEEFLPDIAGHLSEPNGDWTQAGFYYLSQQSKKDMTVVLSGAGGDELFAGYPTLVAAKAGRLYNRLPGWVKKAAASLVNRLPVSYERLSLDFKARSFLAGADLDPEHAHLRYKEIFSDAERRKLLYNTMIAQHDPFSVYEQHLGAGQSKEYLERLLYLDLNVFLPDCVLHITDMTTMMNSQECRVPFLDTEMIDLAERIPTRLKLKGTTTKYILREALKNCLPQEVVRMPKKGFAMPTGLWLKKELAKFVDGVIADAESRNRELFDFTYLRGIVKEHREGKRDHTRKLTALVSFFLWQAQGRNS